MIDERRAFEQHPVRQQAHFYAMKNDAVGKKMTPETWELIKRTGTITGLVGAMVGVASFFFHQNQRIATLEAQMQATTITTSLKSDGQSVSVAVNPVLQACADLAKQLAGRALTVLDTDPVKIAMNSLACDKVPNQK